MGRAEGSSSVGHSHGEPGCAGNGLLGEGCPEHGLVEVTHGTAVACADGCAGMLRADLLGQERFGSSLASSGRAKISWRGTGRLLLTTEAEHSSAFTPSSHREALTPRSAATPPQRGVSVWSG